MTAETLSFIFFCALVYPRWMEIIYPSAPDYRHPPTLTPQTPDPHDTSDAGAPLCNNSHNFPPFPPSMRFGLRARSCRRCGRKIRRRREIVDSWMGGCGTVWGERERRERMYTCIAGFWRWNLFTSPPFLTRGKGFFFYIYL